MMISSTRNERANASDDHVRYVNNQDYCAGLAVDEGTAVDGGEWSEANGGDLASDFFFINGKLSVSLREGSHMATSAKAGLPTTGGSKVRTLDWHLPKFSAVRSGEYSTAHRFSFVS